MKLGINHQHMSQPQGGWTYIENHCTFTADSARALADELRRHRLNNGLPPGDPEHDIALAYAKSHPWLIVTRASVPEEPPEVADVRAFVHRAWRSAHLPAKDAVRDARWERCAGCPAFVPLDMDDHDEETVRRLHILGAGKLRENYGYCQHHRWVAGLACGIAEPAAYAVPGCPVDCWLDKEHDSTP